MDVELNKFLYRLADNFRYLRIEGFRQNEIIAELFRRHQIGNGSSSCQLHILCDGGCAAFQSAFEDTGEETESEASK